MGKKRRRKDHSREFKARLWRRHKGRCALCGQPLAKTQVSLDHIRALSQGGYDRRKNLQPTHGPCNWAKGRMSMGEWRQRQAQRDEIEA